MSHAQKSDAGDIAAFIKEQLHQEWIQLSPRHEWPRFLYHYSDLSNAVKILSSGFLCSRTYLNQHQQPFTDTHSEAVLAWTDKDVLSCARLTFRPLTPIQYHHEGIKSKTVLLGQPDFSKTHSPVPVFFLFDAAQILSRADSRFSEYGLGKPGTPLLSTAQELRSLPWNDIYAVGPIADLDKGKKISRRNAEVVIPDRIDLDSLARIHCRSIAEKETLLKLLPQAQRDRYLPIITASAKDNMFYRKRTFVQTVEMTEKGIKFHFSPDTECPGPFTVKLALRTLPERRDFVHEQEINRLNQSFIHTFRAVAKQYEAELFLDGTLAYAGKFEQRSQIF